MGLTSLPEGSAAQPVCALWPSCALAVCVHSGEQDAAGLRSVVGVTTDGRNPVCCSWAKGPEGATLCLEVPPPRPPVGPGVTSGTCEVQEWGVLLSTPWCCACSMQSQGSYVVGQQREWPPRPGASPHPCLSVARGLTVKEGGLGTCAWQRSQGHTGGPQGARVPLPAKPLTECPEQRLSPRGHFVPSSE